MSGAHSGFQIRQYSPLRLWLGGALILLAMVIIFLVGRAYQAYELTELKMVRETLESRIEDLQNRNASLVRQNAQLASDRKIEHDAYQKVNKELVALQKQLLEQKEQLVFYQGIVSPEELALGVNIQSFELNKKNDLGLYSFKLVLTKRGESNQFVKGTVDFSIKGEARGNVQNLAMKEIMQDYNESETKFAFRYFQVFEGEIQLPENFSPYDIEVEVRPTTRKIKNFSETISWTQALAGDDY